MKAAESKILLESAAAFGVLNPTSVTKGNSVAKCVTGETILLQKDTPGDAVLSSQDQNLLNGKKLKINSKCRQMVW